MDAAFAEVDSVEPVGKRSQHGPQHRELEYPRHVEAHGYEQGAGDARDQVAIAAGGPSEDADGRAENDEWHGKADDEAEAVEERRPPALELSVLDGDAGEMAQEDRNERQDARGDEGGDSPDEGYNQRDE